MLRNVNSWIASILIVGITGAFGWALLTMPASKEMSLYDKIRANTFHVHMPNGGKGSAVYLQKNKALTAGHVCENQDQRKMVLEAHDRKRYVSSKYFMYESIETDLCLITLEHIPNLPGTKLDKEPTGLTQFVFIGGFSGGRNYSIRSGTVYSEEVVAVQNELFALAFTIMRVQFISVFGEGGISGSGVINTDGELVGIANIVGPAGLGMMPLDQIRKFLKDAGEEYLLQ